MATLILRTALLVAALLSGGMPAWGQTAASELQLKAAFLYQFGGFVEWPPRAFDEPDSPFVIGVIGADDMAAELAQVVAQRKVHGRQVTVKIVQPAEPLRELHVVFVGRSQSDRLPDIVSAAKEAAVLVVTDFDNALSKGSMINFVAVENRVRFDVALLQVERSQLKISARLLGVARSVIRARG